MAQVIITLKDTDKNMTVDVNFQPAIEDKPTLAQCAALKVMNTFNGKTSGDRNHLSVTHWEAPAIVD